MTVSTDGMFLEVKPNYYKAVAKEEVKGIYCCEGCDEIYITDKGEFELSPICPKVSCVEKDGQLLGYTE